MICTSAINKMKKNIKEIKQKILDNLEGVKEFEVSFIEEVTYSKIFKAKSKEELENKFSMGELEFKDEDITDSEMVDDSLEIEEIED